MGQPFAVVEENADAAAAAKPAVAAPAEDAPAPKQAAAAPPPPKPAPAAPKLAAPKPAAAAQQVQQPEGGGGAPVPRPERRVPMTRLRRRVAERLKGAQNTYAMLSTFNEVDMTAIMEMRKELKVGGWQEEQQKRCARRVGMGWLARSAPSSGPLCPALPSAALLSQPPCYCLMICVQPFTGCLP